MNLLRLVSLALTVGVAARAGIMAPPFRLEFARGDPFHFGGTLLHSDHETQVRARDGYTVSAQVRAETGVWYRRTEVTVTNTGPADLGLRRVVLFDSPVADLDGGTARVVGQFSGSPVVTDRHFLGVEHPLAENRVADGRVTCALSLMQPLRPGESVTVTFVLGTYPPGQLRRWFLAYLERERARPYAPFLHHNNWYNRGGGRKFTEAEVLADIAVLGRELVAKRGVKLDGIVLDDGWDDVNSLWRFHSGWPEGLKNVTAAAARIGAAPGLWLSPWGGYSKAHDARIAAAAPQGFELRGHNFSLAGPRYYARFRELCTGVVRDDGVVYFKFDGIGSIEATGRIDPEAGRDFDAMLRLVHDLRALRPGIYISQTTGTWPSPWWLFHVDNIWRDGYDFGFAGVGSKREQWITYRDEQTYLNVVGRGPLFPLNSLMVHGILFADRPAELSTDANGEFRREVRSYFGNGTQLQELYLSPERLSPQNWDDLAAAAKWSRANTVTLRDVHWIGGNPGKLEVYGWAAWSPSKGIVTLRNPSDHAAQFTLEAGAAFELPADAAKEFRVTSPYADQPVPVNRLRAGEPVTIALQPFEVLVLECAPVAKP
ncbi:MAG: enterotoxin [Verrucomicrobia bacterium]|nr:enterotoxin [Verrucomicrobiota bacterium]